MKKLLILTAVLAGIVALRLSPAGDYLTFAYLQEHRDLLKTGIEEHLLLSVVTYILVYTLAVAFTLPAAAVLTISGGFFFGPLFGTLAASTGATMGAVCAFLLSRYLLGKDFQRKYADKLATFNRELAESGHLYLLSIRMIPVFPFFVINFLAGLTAVPLRQFFWTTAVGIIPGGFVYAFAGSQLASINSVQDIFTGRIALALVLLGLLSLIPVLVKKTGRIRRNAE